MNAVAIKPETPPAEIIDVSGGLLGVIARAARDPSVDIDKMERLLALQERVLEREAKLAFIEAKRAMRPSLPVITERGKIIIRDKADRSKIIQETSFALFEDLNEILMPIVTAHGFDITFRNGTAPDGKVRVYTVLSHIQGHSEETFFDLPPDGSGSKNAVQAIGSSTSYAKRYGMLEILNITTKGEDDDGATATIYQSSGEPMPRSELVGPHKSKTALRTAVHAIIAAVRAAKSPEAITALLKERGHKATVDQAKRDWLALIDGDPKIPEDGGLRGAVAARKAELNPGSTVNIIIDRMKDACKTRIDLERWMEDNESDYGALDDADSRRFQAAYDEFEAGLMAADRVRAG